MRHIVTALFHSEQAAEAGAAALRARGVPDRDIALHREPPQETPHATAHAPGGEGGLPRLLDALFLPAGDLEAHREAMRRGGFVLTAEVETDRAEELLEALDAAGAADLDEHAAGWRREGWAPAAAAGSDDPRHVATRREPAIGRARSYVIEAPLAEERDPKRGGR